MKLLDREDWETAIVKMTFDYVQGQDADPAYGAGTLHHDAPLLFVNYFLCCSNQLNIFFKKILDFRSSLNHGCVYKDPNSSTVLPVTLNNGI